MKALLTAALAIILCSNVFAKDNLQACWEQQVKPLEGQYLNLHFHETDRQLWHLFQPWQTMLNNVHGDISMSETAFFKNDTLSNIYFTNYSKTQLDSKELLLLDYGDKDLYVVTKDMFANAPYELARYSPAILINYFHVHAGDAKKGKSKGAITYTLTINKAIVTLYISKKSSLLLHASATVFDELYGNMTTNYYYNNYGVANVLSYPQSVFIDKVNVHVFDTVRISAVGFVRTVTPLLTHPEGYLMVDEKVKQPDISVTKYDDHIHFIDMKHTNGKTLVVEFKDFILVAEAPLNSANGELIINEVRKIAPGKPIRYFVFGHYHPDYNGGMRPFVHVGAKIISTKEDVPYLHYLATASHSMQPDSLELEPRPLQIDELDTFKTITDGSYTMNIYFIGKKSEHTNDYKVYYFPEEKMLFEDDLVGISLKGPLKKAGKRQAGLYNALKALNIEIDAMIQGWPVGDSYGMKTEFSWNELEETVNMKDTKIK